MSDLEVQPIDVVGMIGGEVFGIAASDALAAADVVVGSVRHLEYLDLSSDTERVEFTAPLEPLLAEINGLRRQGRRVCVLASGDPGFFGIVRTLGAIVGADSLRVHPSPSSVALAFASQGWSWDDALVASAHGRPLAPAIRALVDAPKAAVLTDPTNSPQAIGAALLDAGCQRDVVVVSRIGEDDEATYRTDLDGLARGVFDPMSVVLLIDPKAGTAAAPSYQWGRGEDEFAHRNGMITKAEVRAVALGKLALPSGGVLWDVGAGSGSVGIEAAGLSSRLRVFSIERGEEDAARIAENAVAHGVEIEVIAGEAPGALAGLPDPDRVFVGGGGIDVLDECMNRVTPGGVLVATYVLLDRALAAYQRLDNMVQVRIDRCVSLGDVGVRMEPSNPVFVCWGTV